MNPQGSIENPGGFPVNVGGFAVPMNTFSPQQLPINQITQIGLTYGTGYFSQQSAAFQKSFLKNFSTLKYYYNVNNSYVVNKIRLLLLPVRHKYWKRGIQRIGNPDSGDTSTFDSYLPPRDDINAPDLYIPTMAFISYVLLYGFIMGTSERFTPEVLGKTATQAGFLWILEVMLIRFIFYLLNSLSVSIIDLVAYCGYKYVGIVITILFGITLGQYGYYAALLYSSLSVSVFMLKTLKLVFPENAETPYPKGGSKRNYTLVAIAALQILECYYLGYNTYSSSPLSIAFSSPASEPMIPQ